MTRFSPTIRVQKFLVALMFCGILAGIFQAYCQTWAYNRSVLDPNLQVLLSPMDMRDFPGQVRKHYQGYQVMVSNLGRRSLTILNVRIDNGLAGQAVHEKTRRETFGGVASVPPMVFYEPLRRQKSNRKADILTRPYANHLSPGLMSSGESILTHTFVPMYQVPHVSVRYRDDLTGEIFVRKHR